MKFIFISLILLASIICKAQEIKIGDNLHTEFNKIKTRFYFDAPQFSNWTEASNMIMIGSKPRPMDCNIIFLALKDSTLIGVFGTKEPNTFLFDINGNSILELKSEFFILPAWVIKNKKNINSNDKKIFSLFDKFYLKTMQADDLELDKKTIEEYQNYQTDIKLSNRHLALLFDSYQTIITETSAKGRKAPANVCIPLIESLKKECLNLYDSIPTIVCIYLGEAYQNAGKIMEAREIFNKSLLSYPNAIPLLVYNCQFELNPIKKKEKLDTLKKKYPKHWMVKDL